MNTTYVPYMLAYKATIFGWILRIKLWESAYTQVMPHSHIVTVRVSAACTISRPLGLRCRTAGVGACAAGGGTIAVYCYSHCCELVDTHALSTHRSRVLVRRWFSLPAYMQVTNFCRIFGRGYGVGLYEGRLIREYIRYVQ